MEIVQQKRPDFFSSCNETRIDVMLYESGYLMAMENRYRTFVKEQSLGPFIVPREFVKNPMNLSQKFILNGKVMQDSNTDRMTHNVYEMMSFASSVITLKPGDLVSMGSPAGVGAGRAKPVFMKNGDTAVCTIESIGSLTNPVVGP